MAPVCGLIMPGCPGGGRGHQGSQASTAEILWENATSIGTSAAIAFSYGGVWRFFHSSCLRTSRLTAVFISIAAEPASSGRCSLPSPMTRFRPSAEAARGAMTAARLRHPPGQLRRHRRRFHDASDLPDAVRSPSKCPHDGAVWAYILISGGARRRAPGDVGVAPYCSRLGVKSRERQRAREVGLA